MRILTLTSYLLVATTSNAQENYLDYHSQVIACEQLMAEGNYPSAIDLFHALFDQYDFKFLREIKVATELSIYEKDYESGFKFIRLGIEAGWTLKRINKNDNLSALREQQEWAEITSAYDSLHQIFVSRLNVEVKKQVHEMFQKDQKKAFGALLRIGEKAQSKYGEKKFAPHSEKQLMQLDRILDKHGYPGEWLIGNNLWTSVILSHHNSISVNYNSKDTLYTQLRLKLMCALKRGEISPYEFAQIEDWKTAALSGHESTLYGFLGKISSTSELNEVNRHRAEIGLRSIELRNKLIAIEKSTGMNFYLPKGWQKGSITVSK